MPKSYRQSYQPHILFRYRIWLNNPMAVYSRTMCMAFQDFATSIQPYLSPGRKQLYDNFKRAVYNLKHNVQLQLLAITFFWQYLSSSGTSILIGLCVFYMTDCKGHETRFTFCEKPYSARITHQQQQYRIDVEKRSKYDYKA